MRSPLLLQVGRNLVIVATTSTALASWLLAGLNSVMSPVPSGTATVGQPVRVAVMPTPEVTSSSPSPAQPASVRVSSESATGANFFNILSLYHAPDMFVRLRKLGFLTGHAAALQSPSCFDRRAFTGKSLAFAPTLPK
jgi:hypothetical protein